MDALCYKEETMKLEIEQFEPQLGSCRPGSLHMSSRVSHTDGNSTEGTWQQELTCQGPHFVSGHCCTASKQPVKACFRTCVHLTLCGGGGGGATRLEQVQGKDVVGDRAVPGMERAAAPPGHRAVNSVWK